MSESTNAAGGWRNGLLPVLQDRWSSRLPKPAGRPSRRRRGLGLRQMSMHFETQGQNSVPNPGTLPLLVLGLLAATSLRRKRG